MPPDILKRMDEMVGARVVEHELNGSFGSEVELGDIRYTLYVTCRRQNMQSWLMACIPNGANRPVWTVTRDQSSPSLRVMPIQSDVNECHLDVLAKLLVELK
jgi:hypothetical protein